MFYVLILNYNRKIKIITIGIIDNDLNHYWKSVIQRLKYSK